MNILLTGSSGFLGEIIIEKINKFRINTLCRNAGDYKIDLKNQVPKFNKKYDLVIHAAGKAHLNPKNSIDEKQFFEINVVGTKNLLLGLDNSATPNRFVFISSVSVYGLEHGVLINEDHPLNAKDPYGLSKIQAENLVINWCEKNNVICTILRLPLLVGENPPGNLGTMINAIKNGYYFNIGKGKARKSMVLADDIAEIIVKVSEIGGVYNLTDGYHPNFNELSNVIGVKYGTKIFNLPIFIAKIIAIIGDFLGSISPLDSFKFKKITSDLTFDDSKARQILGWNPKKVIDYYNIR